MFMLQFLATQMASAKGGVYLPLCLLLLIIPIERKWDIKKFLPYAAVAGICILLAFMRINIAGLITRFFVGQSENINPFNGKEMYTLGYLAQNPGQAVMVFVNTFFTMSSKYVYEFFGGKIGSVDDIQMPWMYVLAFMVLLIAESVSEQTMSWTRKNLSKAIIIGVIIISCLLINLSMLVANTNIKLNHVSGVQGRYFIPVMLALFMIFRKRKDKIDSSEGNVLLYMNVHVVFLFNILMMVLSK